MLIVLGELLLFACAVAFIPLVAMEVVERITLEGNVSAHAPD
jgi:hypothetical protein